jgi:hypothetical protein
MKPGSLDDLRLIAVRAFFTRAWRNFCGAEFPSALSSRQDVCTTMLRLFEKCSNQRDSIMTPAACGDHLADRARTPGPFFP